jgi:hypothetical protein
LLNGAFGRRHLKRRSFRDRAEYIENVSRSWPEYNSEEYIENVSRSWPEYNRLHAHSFEWTWTSRKMRRCYGKHPT